MSKEEDFFVYLLECYAAYKGKPTGEILQELKQKNLVSFILNMYEMYHSESIDNAFMDIDSLLFNGKTAW